MRTIYTLFFSLALATRAWAAPASLPQRNMDLDFKDVKLSKLFSLLADLAGQKIRFECPDERTISLQLKNAPLPVVFDTLVTKANLTVREAADGIHVECKPSLKRILSCASDSEFLYRTTGKAITVHVDKKDITGPKVELGRYERVIRGRVDDRPVEIQHNEKEVSSGAGTWLRRWQWKDGQLIVQGRGYYEMRLSADEFRVKSGKSVLSLKPQGPEYVGEFEHIPVTMRLPKMMCEMSEGEFLAVLYTLLPL